MYPDKSPHPRDIKKSQQYSVDLEEATLLGPSLTLARRRSFGLASQVV